MALGTWELILKAWLRAACCSGTAAVLPPLEYREVLAPGTFGPCQGVAPVALKLQIEKEKESLGADFLGTA